MSVEAEVTRSAADTFTAEAIASRVVEQAARTFASFAIIEAQKCQKLAQLTSSVTWFS